MDADLGLDLEPRREDRKTLHEAPREDSEPGEDIAEASAKETREQPGKELVPKHMPPPIGLFLLVTTGSDDHVELLGEQKVHHRRSGLRIIGQVAVGHHVNVGIDVSEHAPHDMALALLLLGTND